MNAPVQTPSLPLPRRIPAVFALTVAAFLSVLDFSMLNVALPHIATDLGVAPALSAWIINAYQLTIVMTLLPMTALGDRLGRERLFHGGLLLFTLASLACALAQDTTSLLLARILQGLGSAGVMSGAAALLRSSYPPRLLAFGVGLNTMAATFASAAGPSLGAGLLLLTESWRALFLIGVPFGLLALCCTWALPSPARKPRRMPPLSSLLNALCMSGGILGLTLLAQQTLLALLLLLAAILVGWLWIRQDARIQDPLLPLDLFALPRFSYGIATSAAMFAAQAMSLLALSFYFQVSLDFSVVKAGALLTCWPITLVLSTALAVRLTRYFTAATLCAAGALSLITGLLCILYGPNSLLLPGLLLGGLAVGLFQAPNLHDILAVPSPDRSAAAGSIQALSRVGGSALGTALTTLCLTTSLDQGAVYALQAAVGIGGLVLLLSTLRWRHNQRKSPTSH